MTSLSTLRRRAQTHFGIHKFRPGQREVIDAVLDGEDVLVVMPTGAGKSLCYQLPALVLDKPVLVVSPLLSLMQDQQAKLAHAHVESEQLSSALNANEAHHAEDKIREGSAQLIYVTPERLENPEYLALLRAQGVSLFVVDEAHCVSQWGHDFRPAYLNLREAARALGRPPILAVTATATPSVLLDISTQLSMKKPRLVSTGLERANLQFEVRMTPSETAKKAALLKLLAETEGTGIIYVATVKEANALGEWLHGEGVAAGTYHGRLPIKKRKETQLAFMGNAFKVMVATNAFGLGIDKPDVRFVIHYQFPDSLESYYQEAGRAGRDGERARAVLLYQLEDKRVQSYFLGGKYPRREESQRVYDAVTRCAGSLARSFTAAALQTSLDSRAGEPISDRRRRVIVAQLEGAGILKKVPRGFQLERTFAESAELDAFLAAYEKRHADDHARLDMMMRYAETGHCRGHFMLAYFGETDAKVACGHCDNCLAKPAAALPAAA